MYLMDLIANLLILTDKVASRARQTAYRSDSAESSWSRYVVPYSNHSKGGSVSSRSGAAPLRETDEEQGYTQTRELPAEDREAAARASARHDGQTVISPQSTRSPTRNQTDATDFSNTSDSTKVGQNSPTDYEKPYIGTDGAAQNDSMVEEPQPLEKPSRLRRLMGKGHKKGKSTDQTESEDSKEKKHFGFLPQVKVVLFGSWINILLICVPVGIALHAVNANPYASFAVNFLAIIPLAGILSFATEELSLRVGETLGGLLNASFGNAVELIVSIIALFHDEILIVQTSLIGSILSNLLLVLGMCFFFGGLSRMEQFFNTTVAQTSSSLLALAVGTLIIPTCYVRFGTGGAYQDREDTIPQLSRGLAVILLLVYVGYLVFQLKSHSTMFLDTGGKGSARPVREHEDKSAVRKKFSSMIGHNNAAHAGGPIDDLAKLEANQNEEEEKEVPRLSKIGAVFTLCAATALIGVTSEYMVDGVKPMAQYISPEFLGLILIPIVGNAAEHFTAVTVAYKDKMDLAIGVAVGSSMQIALLVLPFIVIVGWIAGKNE